MTRRLRFAALAAVAALAISGCANNDAKRSDVVNAMTDAGLDDEQAECIGTGIDDAFRDDQDLYNDVASALDSDDFPDGPDVTIDGQDVTPEEAVNAVLDDCLGGDGAADEGDTTTTTAGDESGDTTETTEAG
jgi:hypothetical protein